MTVPFIRGGARGCPLAFLEQCCWPGCVEGVRAVGVCRGRTESTQDVCVLPAPSGQHCSGAAVCCAVRGWAPHRNPVWFTGMSGRGEQLWLQVLWVWGHAVKPITSCMLYSTQKSDV